MDRAHFEVVADVDQRHWWFLARRAILRDVLNSLVRPDPQTLVIDIGCGAGANIAALARDYRCVGIDTSSDAIELARARHPEVDFIVGIAPRDLGSLATEASAMLLMDVLEHVEDDRAVLEAIIRSMRPGAILLLTVPADMRLWSAHDEGLMHFRRYDLSMLRRLWSALPVEQIAATYFCSRLYPLARFSRGVGRFGQRILPARQAWDMPVPPSPVNALMQRIFQGESRRLVNVVRGRSSDAYTCGVSLLAVLRRTHDDADSSRRDGLVV